MPRPPSRIRPSSHQSVLTQALATAIDSALAGEPIVAAYVYGSHARGQADAESDLDLALLVDAKLSEDERWDIRLRVTGNLLDAAPDADVIVLQESPVLLQYNVIRTGIVVVDRSASERRGFELDVERRYDDERPYLDRETDLILDRILSRSS